MLIASLVQVKHLNQRGRGTSHAHPIKESTRQSLHGHEIANLLTLCHREVFTSQCSTPERGPEARFGLPFAIHMKHAQDLQAQLVLLGPLAKAMEAAALEAA